MTGRLATALLDALAVLAPVSCAGCGTDDRALCTECRAGLQPAVTLRALADGSPVFAALRYESTVRATILAFKEQARTDVAAALAVPLTAAITAAVGAVPATSSASHVELVALPSGRAAYRRRGFDPVRLLLRRSGLGTDAGVLRTVDRRAEQKGLGLEERAENLVGSLAAVGDIRGRSLLLVDDVLTTGATLTEATRALLAGGADVVGAATLAFTPKLFGDAADPLAVSQAVLSETLGNPSRLV